MRKKPTRPNDEISQLFNDGWVDIYSTSNDAKPGDRAKEGLTHKIGLFYQERRLGIQRHYQFQQNDVKVERVLRVQRQGGVSSQDVAITEDGVQYRIDLVQAVQDTCPHSVDLTLSRITHKYEVPE